MKKKLLSLVLVAAMGVSMLVGCGGPSNNPSENPSGDSQKPGNTVNQEAINNLIEASKDKTIELEIWCSETTAYQTVMAEVIDNFKKQYPDVKFNITLGAQSEGAAKDRVLEDPEAAADVFVFADDQINSLVTAGALQEVVTTYTYDPAKTNAEAVVNATKVNGKMYAYPFTASNGYFLYYNNEFITAEQAQTWDGLIAAAKSSGKKIGMDIGNAWYLYGFFAGAGCSLTMNADGSNTCDWNNAAGLKTANFIKELCANDEFIAIGNTDAVARMKSDGDLIAFVDGTWDAAEISKVYGEHYAATKLPTFTIDGKQVQMRSYAGYKFVGVNSYSQEKGWAMLLAEFVTSEASQAKIGVAVQEAPANIEAGKAPELVANVALSGLAAQSAYSDRQVVGDNFWSPANSLGAGLADGSHTDVQKALDDAVTGITQPKAQ